MASFFSRQPLALLYVLAGVPLGITAEVVPVFLRSTGMSLEHIGWYAAINLPYSFKVLLAPWVDRSGRLRTWLLLLAAALAVAYVWLGIEAQAPRVGTIALALMLMTSASATYDIALDATFVHTLERASPVEHARANAWRLSSFKAAMVAVASFGVILGGRLGFSVTFFGIAVAHLLLCAIVSWQRLPNARVQSSSGPWLSPFLSWLAQKQTLYAFLLAFLYKLSIAAFLWMEKTFWLDRGMTLETIGSCTALVGLIGTLAGANSGSRLVHRYGVSALMFAGLGLQAALGLAYFGLSHLPAGVIALCGGLGLSGFAFGLSTAALMNLITRMCAAEHAATQFAALTGCYAFARAFGGQISGAVAERFGYGPLFLLVAMLAVPAALVVPYAQITPDDRGASR